MSDPFDQSTYQVRFDWGVSGALAIRDGADLIVLVDVLHSERVDAVAHTLREALGDGIHTLVSGDLRSRRALAEWVVARQAEKGDRVRVALVAVGESWADGSPRVAVEDLLGAGAIVEALAEAGIDHCSPEAAAAGAAFAGLRQAVRHLVSASATGRLLQAEGRAEEVRRATEVDADDEVRVLSEFSLRA